ncbi:tRNA methyl transferase [Phlyctochytrium arcticum]|nr:tRNA methyl transferase [Phlyctochytrium arcticum]
MSGGVDSSVSAHLLLQQGYHVTGVFMRNWDERDERGVCPSEDDWRDVQRVCKQLNISCQRVDFCKEYWINVFDHFITDLARGHTPNPDIACNQAIKFGAFFDRFAAGNEGADYIATGHYARVQRQNDGSVHLVRAVDPVKDQTYYLSTVPEASLTRTLFPIGGYHKSDIKRIARDNGLEAIADRRESMGICFIGKRDFGDFVDEYIAPKPGSIVSLDGQRKGHHHGMTRFTIGQRARISGETERWYVVEKDMASNTIYVAPGPTHPALFRSEVVVNDWTWINSGRQNFSELEDDGYIDITVKHRYRMEPGLCVVRFHVPMSSWK